MIAAARAVLDVAEELVKDPTAAGCVRRWCRPGRRAQAGAAVPDA